MGETELKGLMQIAKDSVGRGIYAVRRGNYCEMTNIPCETKSALRRQKLEFEAAGFKVYANRG